MRQKMLRWQRKHKQNDGNSFAFQYIVFLCLMVIPTQVITHHKASAFEQSRCSALLWAVSQDDHFLYTLDFSWVCRVLWMSYDFYEFYKCPFSLEFSTPPFYVEQRCVFISNNSKMTRKFNFKSTLGTACHSTAFSKRFTVEPVRICMCKLLTQSTNTFASAAVRRALSLVNTQLSPRAAQ